MKKTLIVFLLCLGVSITISAQKATPTSRDSTTIRLAANFAFAAITPVTTVSGANTVNAIYKMKGTFADPSSAFDASNVTVGMFFLDGTCNMYKIVAITSASGLSGVMDFNVTPIGASSAQVSQPEATLGGFIFDPSPNLLLPQWVYNMPSKLQGCLLSHMANMVDLKLGSIATPSISIKNANYTLANADDTVLFEIAAAATLTLPAPSASNRGKTYKIGKVDETSSVLTISPAIKLTSSTTIGALNYARTFMVQSDGTSWWVVNQN